MTGPDSDDTVVGSRRDAPRTLSGERSDETKREPDDTVVGPRRGLDDTIAVRRAPAALPPEEDRTLASRRAAADTAPRERIPTASHARRIRIELPRGTSASSRASVGAGPGAVAPYEPRRIPPAPAPPPELAVETAPPRAAPPDLPSVIRSTRRASSRTLSLLAVATVASAIGITAILLTLLSS